MITKLQSKMLMEADFSATNKAIYDMHMLVNVRKYKLMPEEVYSEKNCLAEDGTLSKVLFDNIAQQLRRPPGLASVDADNCCNCIAHPTVCLTSTGNPVPGKQEFCLAPSETIVGQVKNKKSHSGNRLRMRHRRETHVVTDTFLSYELFSLVCALVAYVLSETCGKH